MEGFITEPFHGVSKTESIEENFEANEDLYTDNVLSLIGTEFLVNAEATRSVPKVLLITFVNPSLGT